MARYIGPSTKIARKFGEPIFGSDKDFEKRNYPPGQHGLAAKRKKQREYGIQLKEKQKVRYMYGLLERQFHNTYLKASKMAGQRGENLLLLLESRLDNVIFRLGFARTRKEARQIVDHKFVTVNGKVVNIPSYLVKAGDVIEIKESKKNTQRMKDIVEVAGGRIVPEWLDVDAEKLQGTVKDLPTREQIDVPVDEMLIVELYSK